MPILLALFFFSGASGLLYEVVWLRMLVRAFGSTTVATSNVLAIFMAGLAAGAWVAGRRAKGLAEPLKAYGSVELCLAALACAATWACGRLPGLVAAAGPQDPAVSTLLRSLLSALILLPPSFLMGATLPLMTEHLSRAAKPGAAGPDRPALLYGLNTSGAVAGVLFPGFYSLGEWGETRTVALAVALNAAIGVLALALSGLGAARPAKAPAAAAPAPAALSPAFIARAMAASGFCALALEVLWTRALVLLLGNSVYAFSAMLACYLTGIALGSLLCGAALKSARQAARAFAGMQALAAVLIAVSFEVYLRVGLARSDAAYLYSPIRSASDFLGLFASSAGIVLPVTVVYGLLFPVAARIVDDSGGGEGIARVYGYNTVGSVLGSLACAFLLIPALGSRGALYGIALLHAVIAAAAAWRAGGLGALGAPAFAAGVVALLAATRPDAFLEIVRHRLERRAPGSVSFHREGASATVTGYARPRESLILINGIIVSGKGDLGRFMAHFPLILREAPRRAMVICLGAGNTFRAALDHGVEVDLVELEGGVVQSFADLWPDHRAYLDHPKARVRVNDGRNALLTTRERYDVIVIDGTPPIFSAGTVNLYTREFVELAKSRLAPGGIVALWVPLPCFESEFWMIARNFTETFPRTLAWGQPRNSIDGVLLLGSSSPLAIDPKLITRRAQERKLLAANPWLNEQLAGEGSLVDDAALRAAASRYPAVTDDRPYTEFPLPRYLRRERLQEGSQFVLAVRGSAQ